MAWMRWSTRVGILAVALTVIPLTSGWGQGVELPGNPVTPGEVAESLVSFLSFTAAPGVAGSRYNVSDRPGQPSTRYEKGSFEGSMDFLIPGKFVSVYTVFGYSRLDNEDLAGQGVLIRNRLPGYRTIFVRPQPVIQYHHC